MITSTPSTPPSGQVASLRARVTRQPVCAPRSIYPWTLMLLPLTLSCRVEPESAPRMTIVPAGDADPGRLSPTSAISPMPRDRSVVFRIFCITFSSYSYKLYPSRRSRSRKFDASCILCSASCLGPGFLLCNDARIGGLNGSRRCPHRGDFGLRRLQAPQLSDKQVSAKLAGPYRDAQVLSLVRPPYGPQGDPVDADGQIPRTA